MIPHRNHSSVRHRTPSRFQKKGMKNVIMLAGLAIASVLCLNDYSSDEVQRRLLCQMGRTEEARKLVDDRNLASTMVAYVDEILNGAIDVCETEFPPGILFDEYPPLTHSGGPIPNRPKGTMAYVLTITRCPEWYEPAVDGTPDPGDDLYEMTAVIKDEICNATDTTNELADSSFSHTL